MWTAWPHVRHGAGDVVGQPAGVLELAGLEGDIQRLSTLKRGHLDDQAKLRSALVRFKEQIPAVERRIGHLEATIEKRTETKGEKFRMQVGKAGHTDRAKAAEAIAAILKREARALLKTKDREASGDLGVLAGLPVSYSIETWAKTVEQQGQVRFDVAVRAQFFLEGEGGVRRHGPRIEDVLALTDEPGHSMVTSLEHALRGFEDMLTSECEDLAHHRHELAAAENRLGRPFEHEESLSGKQRCAEEIRAELAADDKKTTPDPGAKTEDSGVRFSRSAERSFGQAPGLFEKPDVRVTSVFGRRFIQPELAAAQRWHAKSSRASSGLIPKVR